MLSSSYSSLACQSFLTCGFEEKKAQFPCQHDTNVKSQTALRHWDDVRNEKEIFALSHLCCLDEESPNFRLRDDLPNTLYMYAYAARGQRHVGKQPRARGKARTCTRCMRCTRARVRVCTGNVRRSRRPEWGTVPFSNSLLLSRFSAALREKAHWPSRNQFLVRRRAYARCPTKPSFHS